VDVKQEIVSMPSKREGKPSFYSKSSKTSIADKTLQIELPDEEVLPPIEPKIHKFSSEEELTQLLDRKKNTSK